MRRLCSEVLDVTVLVSSLAALTHQKPEITPPDFSTVQVTDIFQKLVRILGRLKHCCVAPQGPHCASQAVCGRKNLSEPVRTCWQRWTLWVTTRCCL